MKRKNQTMLGIFILAENTQLLRTIINRHCVKYHQGESNQYLVTNYNDFMNELSDAFEPVQMPSIIL
jgi:superoxide dismutase